MITTIDADRHRRTVISGGLSWIARTVQAVVSLSAAIILARLLTPDAFGVFAMVVPLGVVANQLAGQCFQTALLQRPVLTPDESSGFFWFAIKVNLGIAVAMVAVGFALAQFFDEPRVTALAATWALAILLLTLTTFQEALLKRDLRFPIVLGAQLTGLIVGFAVGITAAARGLGTWALLVQVLVMEGTRAVLIGAVSRWLPSSSRTKTLEGLPELRRNWWSLVGFRLATWINDQPELLAVGRVGGAFALGLYDTARKWVRYPFEDTYVILSDVTVAGARGGSPTEMRQVVTRAMMGMLAVSLPGIIFAGIAADDIILVMLGERWLGAVPYLRILSVAATASAIARVAYWAPLAGGRPELLVRWCVMVQAPVTLISVLAGLRWGPRGVAIAMAVSNAAMLVPCVRFLLSGSPVRPGDVASAVWRPMVSGLAGAAGVVTLRLTTAFDTSGMRLLVASGVCILCASMAWLLMPGGIALVRSLLNTVFRIPRTRTATT